MRRGLAPRSHKVRHLDEQASGLRSSTAVNRRTVMSLKHARGAVSPLHRESSHAAMSASGTTNSKSGFRNVD